MKPSFCLYCGFRCKNYRELREWEVNEIVLPEATQRCLFCLSPLIGVDPVRSEKYIDASVSLYFQIVVADYFKHGHRPGKSRTSDHEWLTEHATQSFTMLLNCLKLDDERRKNDHEMRPRSYFGHNLRAFAASGLLHLFNTDTSIERNQFAQKALPLLRAVRLHESELTNVFFDNDISKAFDTPIETFEASVKSPEC
ncbi:MAG: hypothetical protein R3B84_20870 [Zavarzinella sp.]